MHQPRQKIYAYVDESGQDTYGRIFIVAVVVTDERRARLEEKLLKIEASSGKGRVKWTRSWSRARLRYAEGLLQIIELNQAAFLCKYSNSKNYFALTALSVSRVLALYTLGTSYSAAIFVDGLQGSEPFKFRKYMRRFGTAVSVVRGIRREENNAFIRLADALCGLVRDAESHSDARKILLRCQKIGLIRFMEDE